MSGTRLAELPATAIPCLQVGTVIDNRDPEGRYRVKIEIPGLIDEGATTDWAPPLGTAGGGSPQRGGWVVPDIGATVGVFFHNGDVEAPYYLCGWWGERPDTGLEVPQPAKDAAGANPERVASLQIGSFTFAVDERDDQLTFTAGASDDKGGISVILDFKQRGIIVQATTAIILKTLGLIHLDGLVVRLQDRVVATSSRPV